MKFLVLFCLVFIQSRVLASDFRYTCEKSAAQPGRDTPVESSLRRLELYIQPSEMNIRFELENGTLSEWFAFPERSKSIFARHNNLSLGVLPGEAGGEDERFITPTLAAVGLEFYLSAEKRFLSREKTQLFMSGLKFVPSPDRFNEFRPFLYTYDCLH